MEKRKSFKERLEYWLALLVIGIIAVGFAYYRLPKPEELMDATPTPSPVVVSTQTTAPSYQMGQQAGEAFFMDPNLAVYVIGEGLFAQTELTNLQIVPAIPYQRFVIVYTPSSMRLDGYREGDLTPRLTADQKVIVIGTSQVEFDFDSFAEGFFSEEPR